jgi:hypothetical protein
MRTKLYECFQDYAILWCLYVDYFIESVNLHQLGVSYIMLLSSD